MGVKSKGNYKLNLCLKFDCLDRNTEKCQTCILFSNYIKNKEKLHEKGKNFSR